MADNEDKGPSSSSDDDSVSLLHNVDASRCKGAAEGSIGTDASHIGIKERREETGNTSELFKAPEAGGGRCSQSGPTVATLFTSAKVFQYRSAKQLHKRNYRGETLLHKACKRGDLAQVKALIQAGISVNTEDYAGWTALHEACASAGQSVVEELLRAGADVNARSCNGVTPLHDATSAGNYQVVMLLLQNGSNASDKDTGGLSAMDMTDDEQIKELLVTFQHKHPGAASTEPHCSFILKRCDGASGPARGQMDTDRSRVPSDTEPREKDGTLDTPSHCEGVMSTLKDVAKEQSDLMTCPPSGPKDAGEFHTAVRQIQSVLSELLIKQRLEKDQLALKYRNMSGCLRERVLRGQLISLASTQRDFIEILGKQKRLVAMCTAVKAKLWAQPPNQQGHVPTGQQAGRCSGGGQHQESCAQPSLAGASAAKMTEGPRRATPDSAVTQDEKGPTHAAVQNEKGSSGVIERDRGTTGKNVSSKGKGKKTLTQTKSEDSRRRLSKLVQGGVTPAGSLLQVRLKGHWHHAHVLANGSIKSNSKVHLAPEHWLQSLLGNNIPVSSAYAWDKVTFMDRPLSSHMLRLEGEGSFPARPSEDSAPEMLTAEVACLDRLMKIKIIHLVDDEERLPNALMDHYWEKLLEKDFFESDDWTTDH